MMKRVAAELKEAVPGLIVSLPDAALYSVLDVRWVMPDFDAGDFVRFCATDVKPPDKMSKVAPLFAKLLDAYRARG